MSATELPKARGRDHVKVFETLGWTVRRKRGSHIVMTKPGMTTVLSVPDHKELAIGTLRQLVRAAGMDDGEYRAAFDRC